MTFRRGAFSTVLALVCSGSLVSLAPAQVSDALRDRVGQLVVKLGSDKKEVRDEAEKALVELGPKVLPLLPESSAKLDDETKLRVAKVRETLGTAKEAETNLGATKITIQGKGIRLSEAIQKLQSLSGNTISDLREANGGEAANPSLDLDIKDLPFFEALDQIAAKGALSINFFNGDGSIALMAGAPGGTMPGTKPMVLYSGPFRIQFKELTVSKDFSTAAGTANAVLEVAWEPRLRPMLLAIKSEGLTIVDDRGKSVASMISEQTDDTALRPENPASEVNLNLQAPERAAKEFASLKVKGEVTVPASQKLFKFKSLNAKSETMKQGDISVTLESTSVEEQVWKVSVVIAYPPGGPAFESYRQGLFNNRLWLQKPDGTKFEHNGGFNNTGSDGGKLSFEYLFVDVPGKPADYGLVYETPSKVIAIPLEFEFKKVPLP